MNKDKHMLVTTMNDLPGYEVDEAASPFPDDQATIAEVGERRLEGGEVACEQEVDRAAVRAVRSHPPLQAALIVLRQQVEQDRQLRLVIEVAADHLERLGVENREQLVVAQAQQLLQAVRAQNSWFFSRRDGQCCRVPGSSGFAGGTATPDTLPVMRRAGGFGVVR
jgi:hypothetical protein